ncbi:hypothetical protein [Glycomyces sp. NPDC048151]|uniref:hypothetical protein n=1 Tax=Glycomyces sp. NPDC048151 TaxID=3364002 RepID=UPI003714C8DE
MTDTVHDRIGALARESLTTVEPGADPTLFGVWRNGDEVSMSELGSLTKLLLESERSGRPVGASLELIGEFARAETLEDLGIEEPDNLFAIAVRVETWAVDTSDNEVSLDLANMLTGERRLKEHPDAFTAYACWAHCVDGTGHEAVWRENEAAPRWRQIPPGNRRWRTDQIPKGLRAILETVIALRRQRPTDH